MAWRVMNVLRVLFLAFLFFYSSHLVIPHDSSHAANAHRWTSTSMSKSMLSIGPEPGP